MSALEETLGLTVVFRRAAVADVIQVDGKLGGIQGPVLAQILAGADDAVPGFQLGHGSPRRHKGHRGEGPLKHSAWPVSVRPRAWSPESSSSAGVIQMCFPADDSPHRRSQQPARGLALFLVV